jgi:hypothetical protein
MACGQHLQERLTEISDAERHADREKDAENRNIAVRAPADVWRLLETGRVPSDTLLS